MSADDKGQYALVADDDALIRMDAADILQDAGFQVFEADGVDQAMAILDRDGDRISLLFTDVQMPPGELNGFYLARACAKRWPGIGIVVASGNVKPAPDELPSTAIFIGKPFSADVVHHRLRELLPESQKPHPLRQQALRRLTSRSQPTSKTER